MLRCVSFCLTLSGHCGCSRPVTGHGLLSNTTRTVFVSLFYFFFCQEICWLRLAFPVISDSRSALSDRVRISSAGRHHPFPALQQAHVGCTGAAALPCVHTHFQSSPNMSVTAAFSAAASYSRGQSAARDASQAN